MRRARNEFSYSCYGLGILSVLPLPELVAEERAPDVKVYTDRVGRSPSRASAAGVHFCGTPGEAYLAYDEIGAFLVREGREVIVEPDQGVEERVLRLCILGPVMALLLHQRGLLVLHASAVAINGGAVAFLGERGWGKSTTAAAMHARGHGLVADDVVALDVGDTGNPMVRSGFPQIKLWPDAVVSLGVAPETLPQLHPQFEKRARRVARGFSHEPLPLRRIYVLAEDTRQKIEPLKPQEAFVELVRHSRATRFTRLLEVTGTASLHFRQCARLANCVPVCRLKRPRSLSALPALVESVENDLAETTCPSGSRT